MSFIILIGFSVERGHAEVRNRRTEAPPTTALITGDVQQGLPRRWREQVKRERVGGGGGVRGRERECVCVHIECGVMLCFCRLCVVLLVKESSSYNDTVTRAFRELSASTHSEEISFGYLDVEKQEEFVKVFGKISSHLGSCEEGSIARPVSLIVFVQPGREGGKE